MKSLTKTISSFIETKMPSAFSLALILTFLTFLLASITTNHSFNSLVLFWGDSFWNLLAFSMQMALVLVLGSVIADSTPIKKLIDILVSKITNQTSAVIYMTVISTIACYLNWGFGLVISSIFAKSIYSKNKDFNFPLLVASAYSGFLVWHGGISGSIPLKLTSIGKGFSFDSIPLDKTLFSSFNIIILVSTFICTMLTNLYFSKKAYVKKKVYLKEDNQNQKNYSNLDSKRLLFIPLLLLSGFYLFLKIQDGFSITLNLMIFIFLFLGLLFHQRPSSFLNSFEKNISASSGIFLQFLFYAGMMGVISKSGLGIKMSEFFISISTESTFLLYTYLSAGIVNFFVPSGGGQWAIQGPIMLPAAMDMGISLPKTAMAIAWGDAWTNMIQPFWALPLLSITRAKLKDIFIHLFMIFLVVGIVTSVLMVVL
ncbi:MAG: TIGR00366 family protein [Bacteriovoracaceae bacterium]|jgi:short-chain fatty acids transporter|nr:TIGR00366 family protein [Bacteriovoracaceae bacterium]